jgi:hypothetical protein
MKCSLVGLEAEAKVEAEIEAALEAVQIIAQFVLAGESKRQVQNVYPPLQSYLGGILGSIDFHEGIAVDQSFERIAAHMLIHIATNIGMTRFWQRFT